MAVKRFGVSLEEELLLELDRYVEENGYANRSQAIRFLIEKNVAEQKWLCNHIVAGTVIVMYDVNRRDIAARILDLEQAGHALILSSMQYFLKGNFCLQVITVTGEAYKLTRLADKFISIKGIKHGKLVMSRAD